MTSGDYELTIRVSRVTLSSNNRFHSKTTACCTFCLQFSGRQGKLFPESRKMIYSPIYSSSARVMTSLMLFFLSSFHWNISISLLIYFDLCCTAYYIILHKLCKTVYIQLLSRSMNNLVPSHSVYLMNDTNKLLFWASGSMLISHSLFWVLPWDPMQQLIFPSGIR